MQVAEPGNSLPARPAALTSGCELLYPRAMPARRPEARQGW